MPNLWMHIEYGRRLKQELPSCIPFSDGTPKWRKLYQFGCQGPDFLYYYGFFPWIKDIGSGTLGDVIHGVSCGPFLMACWDRVLTLSESERQPAAAYFAGFLTHHLLDRNLHPYINWKAGYKHRDHQRFEVLLDTVFIRMLNGRNTWETPGWKEIDAGRALPLYIVNILDETARVFYPETAFFPKSGWQAAYRDMVLAQRLLYDPHGWKRKLVRGSGAALFYRGLTPFEEKLDVLNEKKAPWRHSAMYTELRTESVMELWDQALAEGRSVLASLSAWVKAPTPEESAARREQFRLKLGNLSYDTGKDCGSNLVNRFAEPIWETAAGS